MSNKILYSRDLTEDEITNFKDILENPESYKSKIPSLPENAGLLDRLRHEITYGINDTYIDNLLAEAADEIEELRMEQS